MSDDPTFAFRDYRRVALDVERYRMVRTLSFDPRNLTASARRAEDALDRMIIELDLKMAAKRAAPERREKSRKTTTKRITSKEPACWIDGAILRLQRVAAWLVARPVPGWPRDPLLDEILALVPRYRTETTVVNTTIVIEEVTGMVVCPHLGIPESQMHIDFMVGGGPRSGYFEDRDRVEPRGKRGGR